MTLQLNTGSDVLAQVAMTLAAIAYAPGRSCIVTQLSDANLATAGRWALVWYGANDANQVFIARDKATGQQAVSIRGSTTDPFQAAFWLDWFREDFSVLGMADWPYRGAPPGARIAHGSLSGLGSLLSLKDPGNDNQTITGFLRSNATPGMPAAVVGHSLGGSLAYLLAPYLHEVFHPGQNVFDFWPVTFAAPTVGNRVYADWLQSQFGASAGRYYNALDVVPQAWQDIEWIAASFPAGPTLPALVRDLIDGIRTVLALLEDAYVQPGAGIRLDGQIVATGDWIIEAGDQHGHGTYLSLLGAPPPPSCPSSTDTPQTTHQ